MLFVRFIRQRTTKRWSNHDLKLVYMGTRDATFIRLFRVWITSEYPLTCVSVCRL